jgi:Tol biopolymer transport system component
VAAGAPSKFIYSTRAENGAQYSPDGKQIAFESERSGSRGIWVSDADGSHTQELFSKSGRAIGIPRWSPDGQHIAFVSDLEGSSNIHIIRAASGGRPVRLNRDSSGAFSPSWSRDGKWVYFASIQTGRAEVWKVPTGGGKEIQVTRNGGETARESPDGKSIYYTKAGFTRARETGVGLWKMPLSGGEESQVLPSVAMYAFSLVKEGIYFIPGAPFSKSSIRFLNFVTGKVNTVAPMSGPLFWGDSLFRRTAGPSCSRSSTKPSAT